MSPHDFIFWLNGFISLRTSLMEDELDLLRERLSDVEDVTVTVEFNRADLEALTNKIDER
jgi:hypothetical protein